MQRLFYKHFVILHPFLYENDTMFGVHCIRLRVFVGDKLGSKGVCNALLAGGALRGIGFNPSLAKKNIGVDFDPYVFLLQIYEITFLVYYTQNLSKDPQNYLLLLKEFLRQLQPAGRGFAKVYWFRF